MKLRWFFITLLAGTFTTTSCVHSLPENARCKSLEYVRTNIYQLEGLEISVCGYMRYQFEDRNLYDSKQAATDSSQENCLSLGLREEVRQTPESLNDHWVVINGIATANFCPTGSICPASCSSVGVFILDVKEKKGYRESAE